MSARGFIDGTIRCDHPRCDEPRRLTGEHQISAGLTADALATVAVLKQLVHLSDRATVAALKTRKDPA